VARIVPSSWSRDGAGVRLRRILGNRHLPMWDPFLLLDEMHSDRPEDFRAGFPTHPHRGFETVTLMWEGEVVHEDSVGNRGVIQGGGIQWMTAGRGILHSEMPRVQKAGGALWGYQLWVNLPGRAKMSRPRYQELEASAIPRVPLGDGYARVVAGALSGVRGPVEGIATAPVLLDISLEGGAFVEHPLPPTHHALVYVARGRVRLDRQAGAVSVGQLALLGTGAWWAAEALEPSRMLLFAGVPLREPIARRGPFVMNTEAELRQAFDDYRSGRLVGG